MAASVTDEISLEIETNEIIQSNPLSKTRGEVSPCKFATIHDEEGELFDSTATRNSLNSKGTKENDVSKTVFKLLKSDVMACDLLWSLFVSAIISYRRDSVLRPFPAKYCHAEETNSSHAGSKDFEKLKTIADDLSPFHTLLSFGDCENETNKHNSMASIELLLWVLDTRSFSVKSVDLSVFSKIKEKTGQIVDTPRPTHVFEIIYDEVHDSRFNKATLIYAYHGSRLENFHSILRNGLRNHMNKNSLFGEGTYLSSELSVCMPFSPTGLGWNKSLFGEKISCIAVCEIIRHPDVKCHVKRDQNAGHNRRRSHNWIRDGVPEKYYIVQNDELIRIKYLLVYANRRASGQDARWNVAKHSPRNWFSQHTFIIMIMSYFVILVAVGFGDVRQLKLLFRKITF